MDTFYIDQSGYARSPLLDLIVGQDPVTEMMWEHCRKEIGDGSRIYDNKTNRAKIEAIAKAHGYDVEFLKPLKKGK